MRNGETVERPVDHRTLTKRYTDEAIRFIDANRGRPFFLYLAHNLPHIPLARSPEFVGHSAAGIYGDVVEEIDWSTGRVLDALKAAGLDRRTLVVFTSDNGPWLPFGAHGGSAGPLRDGKGTTWEGGVRTPAIFWWPGTIRPAVVTDIGSAMDLFTTSIKLAGGDVPGDRPIDGVDLRARSHDRRAEPAPDDLLLLEQRASRDSERQLQGALHHERRVRRGRAAARAQPAAALQPRRRSWRAARRRRRRIPTSSPISCAKPTRIVAASRPGPPLFDELLPSTQARASSDMRSDILDLVASRTGHFRLESGHHAERWLDLERLCMDVRAVERLAAELAGLLADARVRHRLRPSRRGCVRRVDGGVDARETLRLHGTDRRRSSRNRSSACATKCRPRCGPSSAASASRSSTISPARARRFGARVTDVRACGGSVAAIGSLVVLGAEAAVILRARTASARDSADDPVRDLGTLRVPAVRRGRAASGSLTRPGLVRDRDPSGSWMMLGAIAGDVIGSVRERLENLPIGTDRSRVRPDRPASARERHDGDERGRLTWRSSW